MDTDYRLFTKELDSFKRFHAIFELIQPHHLQGYDPSTTYVTPPVDGMIFLMLILSMGELQTLNDLPQKLHFIWGHV
ncbi:MAG: hypothetical protein EF813_09685 [Methanosarcinales archaeon]|nr:MAG: hypothetical protein EF813_09685 [Methanosarcinales archaeon]